MLRDAKSIEIHRSKNSVAVEYKSDKKLFNFTALFTLLGPKNSVKISCNYEECCCLWYQYITFNSLLS